MLGQEKIMPDIATWPVNDIERSPSSSEISAWNRVLENSHRVALIVRVCELQAMQLGLAGWFIKDRGIVINDIPLSDETKAAIEQLVVIRKEAQELRAAMRAVEDNILAVRFESGDIDIVKPPDLTFGAVWIPIAIGVVVIGGIIARWVQLEQESNDLSDHFNGLIRRVDDHLCNDPTSPQCLDWKQTQEKGGYYKRETVIGNIKDAIKGAGSVVKKGLGIGALIALPLLAMFLLPKGR